MRPFIIILLAGCSAMPPTPELDAGAPDSEVDAGSEVDSGVPHDAGVTDAGVSRDSGVFDAGPPLVRDGGSPDDAGRPIERAFAELAPGELRSISTDISQFRVQAPAGTYWIIDWTPRMHWDPVTKKVVLMGLRRYIKVSVFDDATGQWRNVAVPQPWVGLDLNGHWYGWSAFDRVGRRVFARDHIFNVDTETWTGPIANIPIVTNGSNGSMLSWQSNVGRLARYGGDAQRWMEYDPVTNTWPTVVSSIGNGQHALAEFHAMHGNTLIVGGNNTYAVAQLLAPGGTKRRVADFPSRTSMSGGSWIVPHRSGAWLVRDAPETGTPHLFAYWPALDRWQDLGESPDKGLDNPTVAYDETADAIIIAHGRGTSVWKCVPITQP